MTQRPIAVGLMVCEQVIIEERTGNVTPVNCFSRRWMDSFPSEVLVFSIFALLTDGLGEMQLTVAIDRLDEMDEIFHFSVKAKFTNPLVAHRCIFRLRCSFPVPGPYQISLLADQDLLAQRKIEILRKGKPK